MDRTFPSQTADPNQKILIKVENKLKIQHKGWDRILVTVGRLYLKI